MCTYRLQGPKLTKEDAANIFRGFKAPRKTKIYQERYERRFQRLQKTKQGKANVLRGKIEKIYV